MDENMSVELMYNELREQAVELFDSKEVEIIDKAFQLAKRQHDGQKRSSGEPYIIHPVAVAKIVLDYGMDYQSVAAAMLHDTVEDTDITLEEVTREFGSDIAHLVDGLTKLVDIHFENREEESVENLRKMFLAMHYLNM